MLIIHDARAPLVNASKPPTDENDHEQFRPGQQSAQPISARTEPGWLKQGDQSVERQSALPHSGKRFAAPDRATETEPALGMSAEETRPLVGEWRV